MAKPKGVRLHRLDGTVIDCELVHNGLDEEGMDCWLIANATFQRGDYLTIEEMPGMTGIGFTPSKEARDHFHREGLDIEWQDEP